MNYIAVWHVAGAVITASARWITIRDDRGAVRLASDLQNLAQFLLRATNAGFYEELEIRIDGRLVELARPESEAIAFDCGGLHLRLPRAIACDIARWFWPSDEEHTILVDELYRLTVVKGASGIPTIRCMGGYKMLLPDPAPLANALLAAASRTPYSWTGEAGNGPVISIAAASFYDWPTLGFVYGSEEESFSLSPCSLVTLATQLLELTSSEAKR